MRTSLTKSTRVPEKIFNRQRLCPAGRSDIQSLQCFGDKMKFISFVAQGIDEGFPSMREGRLHERAKCEFFLLTEPRALVRAQHHYC